MTILEYIVAALALTSVLILILRCGMGFKKSGRKRKSGMCGCESGASGTIGTREVQEDAYGMLESEAGIMAVMADGMGKHIGGKIAGRAAVEAFQEVFEEAGAFYNPQYYFRKAFGDANREILRLLPEGQGHASVACALIINGRLYHASAGNVKIAVYRNGELVPVNSGHTIGALAQQRYVEGKLSREEAEALLENHRLYNYVGQDGFHDIEFFDVPVTLRSGDHVLLMTDGMYETVTWKNMEECLGRDATCQEKAYALVELVNQSMEEEKDNASVVVLKMKGR